MKKSIYLCMAFVAMLFSSCANEGTELYTVGGGDASLAVQLKGGTINTRAIGSPTETVENTLKDIGIYVFSSSGQLQKFQYLDTNLTSEHTITGLTTGAKKVVVLTNFGEEGYPTALNYNSLKASRIDLDVVPQTADEVAAKGLPMSGEDAVVLLAGEGEEDSNRLTIDLYRLVAKVRVKSVTILPIEDSGDDALAVNLTSVGVMKALSEVGVKDAEAAASPSYYKAYAAGTGEEKSYLASAITNDYGTGAAGDVYFYVLPYSDTENNATLLTFKSVAGETPTTRYFPFIINKEQTGGLFLKRNTQYALNITLKYHDSGTSSPEEVVKDASAFVTVEVQPWETEVVQDEVWE